LQVYGRLPKRQRIQPKWQLRERQWHKAALLIMLAGGELPEAIARLLPAEAAVPALIPKATGLPSGLFSDVPRRAAGGTPWGSPWGRPVRH
jgi:hypothetical protein